MGVIDFSFDQQSRRFDEHISKSIPDYEGLCWWIERFSRRFVQAETRVVDVGCSTGAQLQRIAEANRRARKHVSYIGIDPARGFANQWAQRQAQDLQFIAQDACSFDFRDASLVITSFTLQFLPEPRKLPLLQRVHDGLIEGGALFLAEKTMAGSSSLQELIGFAYYDHKLKSFTPKQVLDKERRLRGFMTPWTKARLLQSLWTVGFQPEDIEMFWQQGPFVALVATKRRKLQSIGLAVAA